MQIASGGIFSNTPLLSAEYYYMPLCRISLLLWSLLVLHRPVFDNSDKKRRVTYFCLRHLWVLTKVIQHLVVSKAPGTSSSRLVSCWLYFINVLKGINHFKNVDWLSNLFFTSQSCCCVFSMQGRQVWKSRNCRGMIDCDIYILYSVLCLFFVYM